MVLKTMCTYVHMYISISTYQNQFKFLYKAHNDLQVLHSPKFTRDFFDTDVYMYKGLRECPLLLLSI